MANFPVDPVAPFALFDDSLSPPEQARSLLLQDLEDTIVCSDARDVAMSLGRIDAAAAAGRWISVAADYELGYWLEPKVLGAAYRSTRPLLYAHVFRCAENLNGEEVAELLTAHQAALQARQRTCGIADIRAMLDETAYLAAIRQILAYIAEGDCYQGNFTFPLSFRHYGDPLALYAKLRSAQPVRHGAYLHLPERTLLSLSPELFLERSGDRLTARPMKGTAPRGTDPQTDADLRDELAASAKNRAENLMIVDLIRNDLGRLARIGSVRVERLFSIEAYRTVWQMTSTISAEAPSRSLAEIFRALFPCGSVTGAPKVRAMRIISELEPSPRGLYTGALGYVLPGGDFSLNVPIRTLILNHDGTGSMGIGSGIVADSEPEDELAECLLKAKFASSLEVDFQLIETLLMDPADSRLYPLLDDHMQRLAASARYFSFICDSDRVRTTLLAHAHTIRSGSRHRTRLLLDKGGNIDIQSTPLDVRASTSELAVVLAEQAVNSHDLFRYHKTTFRPDYVAELARLKSMPGVFDALFCNERGELCEGARSNIFLSFGGVLHTPPVSAGLLDGVMRRKLLREQPVPVVERTLYPEDLLRADALYISNAVRQLQRVRLIDRAAAGALGPDASSSP